ncbi:FABP family protein [Actinomarinicola tropica]|uniref:Peroxynitrite isomerase n=1 Tax=Actinomarinicola tropica TaxID=2789776 RepID=A0A5Q2RNC8_9ACTN|nr:FABP family protein [Actinomarinicola tropica]QGG96452.1 DUF1794 domain-containing protein [Actinomarinicola tropica]
MPHRALPEGVHPDCRDLVPLLGTWHGRGDGSYPGIDDFSYEEAVQFETNGKPFLAYRQQTVVPGTTTPMHAESGFWRPVLPDRVEVVLAQPTGIAEVYEGTVDEGIIQLRSTTISRTTTAKHVEVMERTFRIHHDTLRYDVRMAAMGQPLTHHLSAELQRVD